MDGVRPEQECLRLGYEVYSQRMLIRAKGEWSNFTPVQFDKFTHQAGMMRAALSRSLIKTPLVLWVEHDLPLVEDVTPGRENDSFIDWKGITETLLDGEVSCIHFCCEKDLTLLRRPNQIAQYKDITGEEMRLFRSRHGVPLLTSITWDSQPHIARIEFYQFLCSAFDKGQIHFDCEQTRQLIEQHHREYPLGWYAPEGDMNRFIGLPARGNETKYPMFL